MDRLRKQKNQSPGLSPAASPLLETASRKGSIDPSTTPSRSTNSSPAMTDENERRFSFGVFRSMTMRSLERRASMGRSDSPDQQATGSHVRKLSKSRPPTRSPSSSSPFEGLTRRVTAWSEDALRPLTPSARPSRHSRPVDWKSQKVEGMAPLQSDAHPLLQQIKAKTPYLVVTSAFLVKVKSQADAHAMFPQALSSDGGSGPVDAVFVIPVASIVAVYGGGEGSDAAFQFEVWWKDASRLLFHRVMLCFNQSEERDTLMGIVTRLTRRPMPREMTEELQEPADIVRFASQIKLQEDAAYADVPIEMFPVALRGTTAKHFALKDEDEPKNVQDVPAFYLLVGTHFCFLLFCQNKAGNMVNVTYEANGLISLDLVEGSLTHHEDRFNLTFCEPFQKAVTFELASRFRRQIITLLGKHDHYLKPLWPHAWQTHEIFRPVSGYNQPVFLNGHEDYGCVKRTLDAYLASYYCDAVKWEINWKTRFAPEFRLLPPKGRNAGYSRLQLLAVLRALRYNDYFRSLSFRDVDLGVLWNWHDDAGVTSKVGWINRAGHTLDYQEREHFRKCPVLTQEFHALAFCSGSVRQIDFTNSLASLACDAQLCSRDLQVLRPILSTLRDGSSKCSHLILAGNPLTAFDIQKLGETLRTGTIQELDVTNCGLEDWSLRYLVTCMMYDQSPMRVLKLASNPGRLSASAIPPLMSSLVRLEELNLCGVVEGTRDGSLIPFDVMRHLPYLRELDMSYAQINDATLMDLERYLVHRSQELDAEKATEFQRLVLVGCGITGSQAYRLFNAIGENHGMHLVLNDNPLEDGIAHLAHAIKRSRGPASLSMEMVEFKNETNFGHLMSAFAQTKHMSCLSLVGTAPGTKVIGPETVSALENFFADNQSVQSLDFSGVPGRLEEGQMGQGFGRSLMGLKKNKTMTWLRVRNQNLGEDAGVLGTVMEQNDRLETFDCQGNALNMTSLQFLVGSLRKNHVMTNFPLSKAEREKIWANIQTSFKSTSTGKSPAQRQNEILLLELFGQTLAELDTLLARNREAARSKSLLGHAANDDAGSNSDDWLAVADGPKVEGVECSDAGESLRRARIRGSTIAVDTALAAACRAGPQEVEDSALPASDLSTPPEPSSPTAGLHRLLLNDDSSS